MRIRRYALLGAAGLGILAAAAASADDSASGFSDHVRAADAAIVRQSKVVGAAVKEGAHKVGAAAKKVAHQVADTSVKVAHGVRDGAKEAGAKTKAAMRKESSDRGKQPVS